MSYEYLPVICLLFPPSFNSILQKGRGLSESSSDKSRASWGQLMAAHTALLPWPGTAGMKDGQGWWWTRAGKQTERQERLKSIGNESSLAWLPVGQPINWFIQYFSSQFLSSTENYFSCQSCFPGTDCSACFKTPDSIIYFLNEGAIANKLFLMLCFNLADVFSVNYEPNSSFHCLNKCVDTDISNPTFPGQDHVSLETNWAWRTLFSHKCWSHWS